MRKIYIAGPISGMPGNNLKAFCDAELALNEAGYVVLNPARLPIGLEEREYMLICMSMVQVCDSVLMLSGWQRSQGAKAEHALAEKLGLNISYQ